MEHFLKAQAYSKSRANNSFIGKEGQNILLGLKIFFLKMMVKKTKSSNSRSALQPTIFVLNFEIDHGFILYEEA